MSDSHLFTLTSCGELYLELTFIACSISANIFSYALRCAGARNCSIFCCCLRNDCGSVAMVCASSALRLSLLDRLPRPAMLCSALRPLPDELLAPLALPWPWLLFDSAEGNKQKMQRDGERERELIFGISYCCCFGQSGRELEMKAQRLKLTSGHCGNSDGKWLLIRLLLTGRLKIGWRH